MALSNITDLRSSVNHSISLPSYPKYTYGDIPVLTTEMLAQAYDVTPKQIRQNTANNRERFIEGKHFFFYIRSRSQGFSFASRKFRLANFIQGSCADTLDKARRGTARKDAELGSGVGCVRASGRDLLCS